MAIYTKTGDKGITATLYGERVSKASLIIQLNGEIDEVNASIGYLSSLVHSNKKIQPMKKKDIIELLQWIENGLYNMGVEVSSNFKDIKFTEEHVQLLEEKINDMTDRMPPQRSFIIYSGTEDATYAQLVRAIVRRCERLFVEFLEDINITSYPQSYMFMNRLSDYLFTLSRYINFLSNDVEIKTSEWK